MRVTRPDQPSYAGGVTFHQVELVLDEEELKGADVVVFGAPMDEYVTNRPGTRFGPRAIRTSFDGGSEEGWHLDLGIAPLQQLRVVDHGDARVVPGDPAGSHEGIQAMMSSVVAAGAVPVVLGGDHSIAYPDIKGFMSAHDSDDVAIVQFEPGQESDEWWFGAPLHATAYSERDAESMFAAGAITCGLWGDRVLRRTGRRLGRWGALDALATERRFPIIG